MNNTVFNTGLYKQTLKKISLGGSVLAMLCYLTTMILTIMVYDNGLSESEVSLFIAPQLFIFVYLGSIILTMSAFSFVNKRNSSDFFFSLPHTRSCLYLSTVSAVITWAVGTVITTILLAGFGYMIVGISVSLSNILIPIAYFSMITLIAIGATSFGISVTGTVFSNIIATGLIVFLPRAIISFVQAIVMAVAEIIPDTSVFGIFDPQYNLVISSIWSSIGGNYSDVFFMENGLAYLYSGVIMIIYFALALLAFNKRKSETAGKSAPNKFIQAIYRCSITTPVIFLFFTLIVVDSGSDSSVLLALFATAFSVYVVYEAVTTKSIKNIAKSLPLFAALVFLIGFSALGAKATGMKIALQVPEVEEIKAVSLYLDDLNEYTYKDVSEVEFSEEEIIDISHKALDNTVYAVKENFHYTEVFGDYYKTITIEYQLGMSTMQRRVKLSENEFIRLRNLVNKNEEYISAKTQIPTLEEISNMSMSNIDDREALEIYKCFLEDFEKADTETKLKILDKDNSVVGMYLNIRKDAQNLWQSYYLSTLTPTALDKYLQLSDNSEKINKSLAVLENPDLLQYMYFSYAEPNGTGSYTCSFSTDFYNENNKQERLDIIKGVLEPASKRQSGEGYIFVNVEMEYLLPYNYDTGEYEIPEFSNDSNSETTVDTEVVDTGIAVPEVATNEEYQDMSGEYMDIIYYLTQDEIDYLNKEIG